MLVLIICIAALAMIFGVGFSITGALLAACLWMVKFPLAVFLWIIGGALCCTLIMIPLGMIILKAGTALLIR